jgi:ABC-type nitrate/sulfonate/bicarbonate transport system permease component
MIGATVGMGYMILEAQQTFRTERVLAGIFVIGAIGYTTDLGFRRLRKRLLPWYQEMEN